MTCNYEQPASLSHLCTESQVICRRTLLGYRHEGKCHHLLPALLRQVPILQGTSLYFGLSFLTELCHRLCFSYPHEMWDPLSWSLTKTVTGIASDRSCLCSSSSCLDTHTPLSHFFLSLHPSSRSSSCPVPLVVSKVFFLALPLE